MIVSPYLSILLIAFGLALIYLFRAMPSAKKRNTSRAIYADMTIAADVARASARQVFNVELDLTDKSIVTLEKMISEGWSENISASLIALPEVDAEHDAPKEFLEEDPEEESEIDIDDSLYVLSGYLGTTLAHNHNGVWKSDDEHPLPYVYFKKHDFAVSPFSIVKKKLQAPQHFDLVANYNNIVWELSQLNSGVAKKEADQEPLQPNTPRQDVHADPTDV